MTDSERIEALEKKLEQTELLYKQEQGKRIAVERENAEVKRQSKLVEEQAAALKAETEASLSQAAEDMKIALAVSQGVWALAHMGRSFLARKIAAARIVHREQQTCLLMEKMIESVGRDPAALQTAVDQAKHIIATVKRDGEATRVQINEVALQLGLDKLLETVDDIIAHKNDVTKGE